MRVVLVYLSAPLTAEKPPPDGPLSGLPESLNASERRLREI
jgi:hypothetical protein